MTRRATIALGFFLLFLGAVFGALTVRAAEIADWSIATVCHVASLLFLGLACYTLTSLVGEK